MRPLLLGDALAEAHEQERRAHADRAAEHGERHAPPAERRPRQAALGRKSFEPAVQRLAGQDQHERDALQHEHGRVGQVEAALQHAAARGDAADEHGDRHDGERVLARDERDEDAARSRSRRSARRWRCRAPRRPPPCRRGPPPRRRARRRRARAAPTGSPASRAARALPPTMRSAKPYVVWRTSTYTTTQKTMPKPSPQCTSRPGRLTEHVRLADGGGRRLVQARRIAQRPLDEVVEERDRDVGEQQARDRLVDAAVLAQRAGERDPEPRRPAMPADGHGRSSPPSGAAPREQVTDDGGGEPAEHERALAADHHQARPAPAARRRAR